MSKTVLKIENISKQYRLGEVSTGTLSHDLNRWWHRIRRKEDPYLKIGETNDRSVEGVSEYVWALRDINFEVKKGEVLGIIGKNGAGKSTLLKILSKVTGPSTGTIKVNGRIASLLEVGTGFHPELTGRENIYLNGAILGMTKAEVSKKLDEIVSFAGVARYLDTPVKRYSSGMMVRLGFAVAAHLEPEILIVDEVLAVGDADFQKKAIGKMQDVSQKGDRTILFVSHNMESVSRLCSRAILLDQGMISHEGPTPKIIEQYLFGTEKLESVINWEKNELKNNFVHILEAGLQKKDGTFTTAFEVTEPIFIYFKYKVLQNNLSFTHGINLHNEYDVNVFDSHDIDKNTKRRKRKKGEVYNTKCKIPSNLLAEGTYFISLAILNQVPLKVYLHQQKVLTFRVSDMILGNSARGEYSGKFPGLVRPLLNWETQLQDQL